MNINIIVMESKNIEQKLNITEAKDIPKKNKIELSEQSITISPTNSSIITRTPIHSPSRILAKSPNKQYDPFFGLNYII